MSQWVNDNNATHLAPQGDVPVRVRDLLLMPTKEKNPEMWEAVHIAVLRKHHCLGSKCCGQAHEYSQRFGLRKDPIAAVE